MISLENYSDFYFMSNKVIKQTTILLDNSNFKQKEL